MLLLIPVKLVISPEPLDAKPILGVSLTQVYIVVPSWELFWVLNVIAVVVSSLHKNWSSISSTWLEGLTVIVKVWEFPWQVTPPFSKVGVTVTVAATGEVPELDTLRDSIFPFPELDKLILGVSFSHE